MNGQRRSNLFAWVWICAAALAVPAVSIGLLLQLNGTGGSILFGFIGAAAATILLLLCVARSYADDGPLDEASTGPHRSEARGPCGPLGRLVEAFRVFRAEPFVMIGWTALMLLGAGILSAALLLLGAATLLVAIPQPF